MGEIYKQCKLLLLKQDNVIGEDYLWIQGEFAKVGQKVVDESGTVWQVAEVYGAKQIEDVQKVIDAYREFRDKLDPHR